MNSTTISHHKTKRSLGKKGKIILTILTVLIVIRLILPYVILHFVNKRLAALDGYYGHVEDINLALIRGAYVINDVYIDKVDDKKNESTPFFSSAKIDLSVEWSAIFEGKIVGEVEFDEPVLKYTMHKTVGKKAPDDTTNFLQLVKDFMPMRINRFTVNNGEVHYIDKSGSPDVDLLVSALNLEGRGLTNNPDDKGITLSASIDMTGNLYDGTIEVNTKLDPLNDSPTFDLNGKLSKTNLTHLNNFFQAYANFDVKKGTMSLYTEIAAKDGKFKGYVKPLLKDLDIVEFNKEEGSVGQIAWEAFVGGVAEIFENQPKDQFATKVMLEGKFSKPDVAVFDAIISVLKNAFIKAIEPSLENTISVDSVPNESEEKKGFFKRIFDKDKDEKGKE